MERRDITAARQTFLRMLHELRTSGDSRPIYHLDKITALLKKFDKIQQKRVDLKNLWGKEVD